MGEAEGAEGAAAVGGSAGAATEGAVGDAADAAAEAALGSEANAYVSGYTDASLFNVSDTPAKIQPGMEDVYAEGYGAGVADAIADMDQNAALEQREGDSVSVLTPEQEAADDQAQAEIDAEMQRMFGQVPAQSPFGGMPKPPPRGPDGLPEDPEVEVPEVGE